MSTKNSPIYYNVAGALFTTALLGFAANAAAQDKASQDIEILNKEIKKTGDQVTVTMDLNLDKVKLSSNRGLVYTPTILNDNDTLKLPAVEVMGRKRYIYYLRNHKAATENPLIVTKRNNGEAQTLHYAYTVPYEAWMKNSQFAIGHDACGCNQTLLADNILTDEGKFIYTPENLQYAFVQPKAEAQKVRNESGSARLNFKVGKWDVVSNLGNNAKELENIQKTISLVKDDADVTITGITLHGYASPDGKYAGNEKLARNRTNALLNKLVSSYGLDKKLMKAESTAEDWDGTLEYINSHDIPQKEKALKIINSNLTPDEKETSLVKNAGEAYRYLIQNVWPGLRRTDYTIQYDVKAFNLEEAKKVINTRPQKLSLEEMYMVAQSYPKGSEEYNNVFDIAAKMFPEDETANVNAAIAAINRGDKVSAEKYLQKAGTTAEAENARGCLDVLKEDYDSAKQHFETAAAQGLQAAQDNLKKL